MIRVADPARPGLKPVFPSMLLNLTLAFLFTPLSVGAAVLSDVLDKSIRNPEQVASLFQTEVMVGSLPLVKPWHQRLVPAISGKGSPRLSPRQRLRRRDTLNISGFDEAVRTLRNSILLGAIDRRLKSLMVTSATPSEGKTTTAVHLAIAHAQQKHKTLLIDGDLRPQRPLQAWRQPGYGLWRPRCRTAWRGARSC